MQSFDDVLIYYLQPYLQHAQTLSAMGYTEEAIISYCLCVHFNRNLSTFSTNNKLEVAKVRLYTTWHHVQLAAHLLECNRHLNFRF